MRPNKMIEHITYKGKLLSVIIRTQFEKDGIEFFTPDEFSQQLAYMKRPSGYVIAPHIHNIVNRQVQFTQEVLFIKSGRVRVDFYNDNRNYIESCEFFPGDVILLAAGGHGITMLEESEIIEVKQGPYTGEKDKSHFEQVDEVAICIK